MKLSELTVGKDYAIVPSWTYNSKSARSADTVRENDVVKATLVELTKYEYEPSQRKQEPNFRKAEAGNRSVGVLVKGSDNNGTEYYWTSRLADIVAEWSVLEPKWKAKQSEQDKKEQEERERRKKEQLHVEQIRQEVERSRQSIMDSAKELLGATNHVEVTTNGYGIETHGVVTFSLKEFEQLIELAYAGKDN
jgi:hypothetical protein